MNVVDTFNRANENPVSDGGKWTIGGPSAPAAGPKIVSNQLTRAASSPTFGRNGSYRNDISYTANVDCQVGVTIAQMSNDGEVDLYLFNSGTKSGYVLLAQSSSFGVPQVVINRSDAGTQTSIATDGVTVPASGDVFVLRVIGSNVAGWLLRSGVWSQLLSATDTTYRVTFNPGLEVVGNVDTTTMILDDFGTNIVPPPATVVLPADVPLIYNRKNL